MKEKNKKTKILKVSQLAESLRGRVDKRSSKTSNEKKSKAASAKGAKSDCGSIFDMIERHVKSELSRMEGDESRIYHSFGLYCADWDAGLADVEVGCLSGKILRGEKISIPKFPIFEPLEKDRVIFFAENLFEAKRKGMSLENVYKGFQLGYDPFLADLRLGQLYNMFVKNKYPEGINDGNKDSAIGSFLIFLNRIEGLLEFVTRPEEKIHQAEPSTHLKLSEKGKDSVEGLSIKVSEINLQ